MLRTVWKLALLCSAIVSLNAMGVGVRAAPDLDRDFRMLASEVGGVDEDCPTCSSSTSPDQCCCYFNMHCCTCRCGCGCDLMGCYCNSCGNGCPHSSPHSHTYGSGSRTDMKSDTVTGGDELLGYGLNAGVADSNVADCNEDGVPGDFDGDYESGLGGGFFGHGAWADEATCNYGLRTHGSFVVVSDAVFGSNIAFVIGADDTSGPVIEVDPVDGSTSCSTSGSITPGDPATDPTADSDDCLTDTYQGSGSNACGGGGDGGFWVFLYAILVEETAGNTAVNVAPTFGTITA